MKALGGLATLLLAALLEVGGLAAIRRGALHSAWLWLVLGAAALVAYGLVVNGSRTLAFGQLMGLYISVFFVVSQMLGFAVFAERPTAGLLIGGALIVAGGIVIQTMGR